MDGSEEEKDIDNTRFYELLQIEQKASQDEIKKAFRKIALKAHPDKGGDPEKVRIVPANNSILMFLQ